MTQNCNNEMTLYVSNVRGRKTNTSYPYEAKISCIEDLARAAQKDHVGASYKDKTKRDGSIIKAHRSNDTFIEADNLPMDCDNEEKNPMKPDITPEEWKHPADVQKEFPGVAFYAVPSRNHMKPKNGLSPRPKWHYYFPLKSKVCDYKVYAALKATVQEYFPAFDDNALDAGRFIFGVEAPQPVFYPGERCIDEFIAEMEQRLSDDAAVIACGSRNATLSKYAFRVLKRHGINDDTAYNLFVQKAACCEQPLDDEELQTIWNSAAKGYKEKVLTDPNYIAPEQYDAMDCFSKDGEAITSEDMKRILGKLGVTVRLNLITGCVDIEGLPPQFSQTNAANVLPVFLMDYMKQHSLNCSRQDIDDCLVLIEDENRYNPVADMFAAIEYDGQDRIPALCEILDIQTDGQEPLYLKKWLWQTVALPLNDEIEPYGADGVLVLQGAQGAGKTRFFSKLSLRPDWFSEGASIDLDKKDTVIQATTCWIAELGELDSTLKREQSALKAFLTTARDTYRMPYARVSVRKPRRTSFCATVNPEEFLNDETGSRRFWTIHVGKIDIERLNALTPEWIMQLWAQVYNELYLPDPQGFRLTTTERTTLEKDNEKYSKPMPGELEIMDGLKWDDPEHNWKWRRVMDIKDALRLNLSAAQIGKALARIATCDERIQMKAPKNVKQYYLPRTLTEFDIDRPPLSEVEPLTADSA